MGVCVYEGGLLSASKSLKLGMRVFMCVFICVLGCVRLCGVKTPDQLK